VNVPRETIAAALLTLLQGTKIGGQPAFLTTGRRARVWGDVTPGDQPAAFLNHGGETAMQDKAYGATKWLLHFEIVIYLRADATPDAVPDTAINAILDAVDAQILGTPGQRQTLGKVVYQTWIEGEILIDTGILDQQVAILIPIKVLTGI
jgi:hypothetical protein